MALIILVGFLAYQGVIPPVLAGACVVLKGISMFISVNGYIEKKKIRLSKLKTRRNEQSVPSVPFMTDDSLDEQIDSLEDELKKY